MGLKDFIIDLLQDFGSAFMPYACHRCKVATDFGVVFCADCQAKLVAALHAPKLTDDTRCDFNVYTLSSYSSLIADVIRIIKYRPSARLLKLLAGACHAHGNLKSMIRASDVIIPVPMHSRRLSQRGFNQAEYLAENFAKAAECNFCPALVRTRATRPQADCNEEERRENLKNAFALNHALQPGAFSRQRLILVDDVATTGSTLQLCADELKALKPAEISALVVSHSYKLSV